MKIYIIGATKSFIEDVKKALEKSGQTDVTAIVASKFSAAEVIEKAPDCEILVAGASGFERISKELIDGLPHLKLISTIGVGTDWIDLKAAKERGVIVSNQKGVNAESVAQQCFGMILDVAKQITQSDRGIRERGEYRYSPYLGKEIYGKTIGIIGLGGIGQKVARIASGFSMEVIGVNKNNKEVPGVTLVSLEELLKRSDVIAVTVPLTPETENLLSEKEFSLMKDGVILVSISREKIINKEAVLKAVDSGKIFGFGLETEIMTPIEKNDPYLTHERIVITPHTGAQTEEADQRCYDLTVDNVNAFLAGKPVRVVT